jgi:hypothetical protein
MKRYLLPILALLILASLAVAQEKPPAKIEKAPPPAADPMMEAWMKASSPGEAHKLMERHVGVWDAEVRLFMDPAGPPMITKGKGTNTLILGGRYLESRFKGEFEGQPFEGIGYMGYDNVRKEFVNFWIDSTSTWFMFSAGTADKEGKVWKNTGEVSDPVTGKAKPYREEAVFETPDRLVSRAYDKGPDGREFLSMEIVYTRAK